MDVVTDIEQKKPAPATLREAVEQGRLGEIAPGFAIAYPQIGGGFQGRRMSALDSLARKNLGWTKDFVTLEAIDAASADSVERSNLHDGLRQAGYLFTTDHGGGYAPGKDLADKSAASNKAEDAERAAASADPVVLRREALDWALKFAATQPDKSGADWPVYVAMLIEDYLAGTVERPPWMGVLARDDSGEPKVYASNIDAYPKVYVPPIPKHPTRGSEWAK